MPPHTPPPTPQACEIWDGKTALGGEKRRAMAEASYEAKAGAVTRTVNWLDAARGVHAEADGNDAGDRAVPVGPERISMGWEF